MNQFEEIRDGKVDLEELLKDVVSRKNGQAFLTCVFLFGETGFLSILDDFSSVWTLSLVTFHHACVPLVIKTTTLYHPSLH